MQNNYLQLMITDSFRVAVEENLGGVVILAGSGSDEKHIDKVVQEVRRYALPVEVRICSAHKQSEDLINLVREYDRLDGQFAYIAVAGGTDALSGTSSFISNRPTISCPPDHPNMSGLTNPLGSSNAYVGRPENVARFVAQLFSYINSRCNEMLSEERVRKINKLLQEDGQLREKYCEVEAIND